MKQRTLTGLALAAICMVLLVCFHLPLVPQIAAMLLGIGQPGKYWVPTR